MFISFLRQLITAAKLRSIVKVKYVSILYYKKYLTAYMCIFYKMGRDILYLYNTYRNHILIVLYIAHLLKMSLNNL